MSTCTQPSNASAPLVTGKKIQREDLVCLVWECAGRQSFVFHRLDHEDVADFITVHDEDGTWTFNLDPEKVAEAEKPGRHHPKFDELLQRVTIEGGDRPLSIHEALSHRQPIGEGIGRAIRDFLTSHMDMDAQLNMVCTVIGVYATTDPEQLTAAVNDAIDEND